MMKVLPLDPPRSFQVGVDGKITVKDCGRITLEPNEQVTFATPSGTEYDVVRKSWGYYATPSTNGRLVRFGLRAALMRNETGATYVVLVEKGKEAEFTTYLSEEKQELLLWLDGSCQIEGLLTD